MFIKIMQVQNDWMGWQTKCPILANLAQGLPGTGNIVRKRWIFLTNFYDAIPGARTKATNTRRDA